MASLRDARAGGLPLDEARLLALARDEPPENSWHANSWHANDSRAGGGEEVWARALWLVQGHGLGPLLHERTQAGGLRWLPESVKRELRAVRIAEVAREAKREKSLRSALGVLAGDPGRRERPLPTVLIKGAASARTLYAHPELRPRSDLDLLLAPADRTLALERFRARGYSPHEKTRGTREDEPDWHERTLVDPADPSQQLDLHFALAQPQRHRLTAERLLAASVPAPALGAAARVLPAEEAALVCAHALAIHELGAPLVALCDLARLVARADPLRLAALARLARLERALFVSVSLLAQLGPAPGAPAPAPARLALLFSRRSLRALPCAPYALCGEPVDPARLARLLASVQLALPTRELLRAAAGGYLLARAPLPRARQLWRKALFIDRPGDAVRFAAAHALRSARRAARFGAPAR